MLRDFQSLSEDLEFDYVMIVHNIVVFATCSKFQTKLLNYYIILMTIVCWHKTLNGLDYNLKLKTPLSSFSLHLITLSCFHNSEGLMLGLGDIAPLDVIEEAIELIINGRIIYYSYDNNREEIKAL